VAFIYAGNDLLSHTLSRAVQSALRGLTSVFGMGTGGPPRYDHRQIVAASSSFQLEHDLCGRDHRRKLVKDREDETSQLNRLDWPTFFFAYFPISAVLRSVAFHEKHRRKASAELPTSSSGSS
jgi:hypothetical protein